MKDGGHGYSYPVAHKFFALCSGCSLSPMLSHPLLKWLYVGFRRTGHLNFRTRSASMTPVTCCKVSVEIVTGNMTLTSWPYSVSGYEHDRRTVAKLPVFNKGGGGG